MGGYPRETLKPSLRPAHPKPPANGRPKRVPYKVVVALFPYQWADLRAHVENRAVSGSELVSTIVNDWLLAHPAPPAPPPPEPTGDQGEEIEVSQLGY